MIDRRRFLQLAALGGTASALAPVVSSAQTDPVATNARIVIIGAGAAGTALVNRLARRLDGASITVIDPRTEHLYQPGLTLVATGLKPPDYVVSQTTDWLPGEVSLIPERVMAVDPVAKTVETEGGQSVEYDWLVVAPGLVLDHDAIEGFSLDMVGENGIGALYAGPDYAARTWQAASRFTEEGGTGIFTRPATEMKCAGAPVETRLSDRRHCPPRRQCLTHEHGLCALRKARSLVCPSWPRKCACCSRTGVSRRFMGIRSKRSMPGRSGRPSPRTVARSNWRMTISMSSRLSAHPTSCASPDLPWADRWTDQGWVEVDPGTLRHRRYDDILHWAILPAFPRARPAASAKWQVPVVEDHLVAAIAGQEGTELYNGYTSCPMITRIGRAMLVEFDYQNNLVPSFPGFIAPLEELWISWLMKEVALKATYNAMLRGRA